MLCKIIPEKCIACGLCQVYAPEIFDYNDDGIVILKNDSNAYQEFVPDNERNNALTAYRKCPVRAIEIIEK
ncbi:ferredoxin [Enterococcus caccae]|uniref:Ferredoxin n=1 Tax=Enterococcus caccae ATCC BAA-1240 TaxID=1158612 RepID=R3WA18_9ENTE|nr:ferredoxin [Enterococcus caccae]EOL44307.1 ferredoxin [Enterococcus caccae ATCC BAA-1240]EOT68577.1 ferredoxin [Enterococcus caccae ATCC BAA-1240]OJG28208.1 ferredoxin [Enterococcus caccae]